MNKPKWTPNEEDIYYTPCYLFGSWGVEEFEYSDGLGEQMAVTKGEVFKTYEECDEYIEKNMITWTEKIHERNIILADGGGK